MVIRGGIARAAGFALGLVFMAAASVLLLRHLGVVDLGRFATVMSLIGIVSGVTDVGLNTIGARDLARRPRGPSRQRLLANLVGLRLIVTPIGVIGAALFAFLAGYDDVLVFGTLLAGAGLVLLNAQATLALPLSIDLKVGRLAATDALKQGIGMVVIAVLVVAGSSLFFFFSIYLFAGVVLLAMTPPLIGRQMVWRPRFERDQQRALVREALPLAGAIVMNVLYFRVLIIMMSLLAAAVETGLFATSFRIFEMLYLVPTLVVAVALPVASVAARDPDRLRYILQRMLEASAVAAVLVVMVCVILAAQILDLLGGAGYRDAAPVLQIQALALIPVFGGQVFQLGLISMRRQRDIAVSNAIALALVVGLGAVLIPTHEATGAAIAAVAAEILLALCLLLALAKAGLTVNWSFGWRVLGAAAPAVALAVVLGGPPALEAGLASLVYVAAALLLRAVPREVLDAIAGRRQPRPSTRS